MMITAFDPSQYKPGDSIFVRNMGWHETVAEYKVVRVTPGGQIVAEVGGSEIRISKHGGLVGERWGRRSVVSAERAAEIRSKMAQRDAWSRITMLAEKLGNAARKEDEGAAEEAFKAIASALEARRGETAQPARSRSDDIATGEAGDAHIMDHLKGNEG